MTHRHTGSDTIFTPTKQTASQPPRCAELCALPSLSPGHDVTQPWAPGHRRAPGRARPQHFEHSRCSGNTVNTGHTGVHAGFYAVLCRDSNPSPRARGGQQREKVLAGSRTDSAGRAQARTCLPENPLPLPGALSWHGRGWEGQQGRRERPVGSGPASALPTAQSWAPCHVHMPLGAWQMFSFRGHHGT